MFTIPSEPSRLRPVTDAVARRATDELLARFAAAFPDIAFDLAWESDSLNAQAFRLAASAHVRLYGGLARHLAIGPEGVAFALAHEAGHHKAGPPFDRFYDWMSSDRKADEWALSAGLPAVFGRASAAQIARAGVPQLFRAIAQAITASGATAAPCGEGRPCFVCRCKFIGDEIGVLPDLGLKCSATDS